MAKREAAEKASAYLDRKYQDVLAVKKEKKMINKQKARLDKEILLVNQAKYGLVKS